MGKDVIDLAALDLRRVVSGSCTDKLPLVGADGYFALTQQVPMIAKEYGLPEETITHLLNRYGSLINEVLAIVESDKRNGKPLDLSLPYIKAEIIYAVTHEGAMSVDDVISRRTRLAFEAPNAGLHLVDEIATIIAPLLGWSAKEKKASIAHYQNQVAAEVTALAELINS
jgi:glycerol-3-phosphate dehydrogenase